MNLEDNVRAAVRDLADDAPVPHDLAAVARVRGRRLRRRRQAGFGALVVAVVAIVVTPFALPRGDDRIPSVVPAPPATDTPKTGNPNTGNWWESPYRLPGGAIITALSHRDVGLVDAPPDKTVHDGNVLLNRKTGKYAVLPASYYTIWGAPVGGRAVASDGEGNIGIVDAAGGRGIWRDIAADPVWSADGTRILFATDEGFGIMAAATGEVRYRSTPMDWCPDFCTFSWLPGDQQVAVARRDPEAPQSEDQPDVVKDVAIYAAADGRLVRIVPVPGVPLRQDAWSPDGRLVLVRDPVLGQPNHVVEVGTGRGIGRIPGENVHFLPNGQILSLTDREAVLYDPTGKPLETQTLPYDLRARELSIGRL